MGCFCVKEQARVERSKRSKHFRQGVHPKRQTGHHNAHTVNALSPFLIIYYKKISKNIYKIPQKRLQNVFI